MAKFLFWSDLHLTHQKFDPPVIPPEVDAVLIAGDTDVKLRHLRFGESVARASGRPVVMIWGNHEPYGGAYWDLRDREAARLAALHAQGVRLHVLHGEAIEIAGVRVIGATLWSGFGLFPGRGAEARGTAQELMNDYRAIRWGRGRYRRLDVADTAGWHVEDRRKIFSALDEPFDGPRLVMTHHAPSPRCLSPVRRTEIISAAYASDLEAEIRRASPKVWIHGHTHERVDVDLQGASGLVRIRSNARGYPGEKTDFDPLRTLVL